jgi:jumonji domain-containing protein 7
MDDELADLCASQPAPLPRGEDGQTLRVPRLPFSSIATGASHDVGARFFEFVRRRQPVILTGCVDHWPALSRWTHAHLRKVLGDHQVHVARTPDGLGDAVTRTHSSKEPHFAKPYEALMPFSTFVDAIESPLDGSRAVHYCSHQNSSLTSEFAPLWEDVEQSLPWADAAFGHGPAAANFWMGEDAARTTVHADLFDNLYVVVRGTKEFTLLPPQDGHLLRRRRYRSGTYTPTEGAEGDAEGDEDSACGLRMVLDVPPAYVHWTDVDLESAEAAEAVRPVRATVEAAEVLYLPALWWHAVSQRGPGPQNTHDRAAPKDRSTIAVNYWYEGPVAMGDEADAAAERAADKLVQQLLHSQGAT